MSKVRKGQIVGPYRIIRELADSGGMSLVYEAEVVGGKISAQIGQRVALKVARVFSGHDDAYAQALTSEIDLLNRLHHPGIVRPLVIPSYGHYVARAEELPGSPFYFAMEMLRGGTLADALARSPSLHWRLEMLYQIAAVINYLHLESRAQPDLDGVAHRDLKPGNVMFREAPRGSAALPQPVLIDFGLSHKRRIQSMFTAMTIDYAAPERVAHYLPQYQPTEVDFNYYAADVWALAVMAYEMLTGRWPFGPRDASTNRQQIAYMICYSQMQPLDLPQLPRRVERVLAAALEKHPDYRPTTVEILQELGNLTQIVHR